MQKLVLFLFLVAMFFQANAQTSRLASGSEYQYYKRGAGKKTANPGDFIGLYLKGKCGSQLIFDTKTFNKGVNAPVNFPVTKKTYNGDIMEVLGLLHEGDSVVVRIPQDSFYRRQPQEMRKGVKAGDPVIYNIGVTTIKSAAQFKKEQEDYKKQMAQMAKMQAEMKKQQDAQAKQVAIQKALVKTQDADIKKYLVANNITNAVKTETGLYVAIDKEGTGDLPKTGNMMTMNYDGKLLDGTKFDSNIDSAFNHVSPFTFKLGMGQVIQGWDQGIKKFKVGSKGRLIIPSGLAYGPNAQNKIPANSILDFGVEVLDMKDSATVAIEDAQKAKEAADKAAEAKAAAVKTAADEENTILQFLQTNNYKCTRTNSGLHVLITNPGTGAAPTVGDDVTMNYTGMFLDGKKFDSNLDSTFGHVSPFNFPLGQGRVIKGWDEGVAMLKKGGKAKFIIPSALAYGANGNGTIPANSVLQFDVELVDFKKAAPSKMTTNTQPITIGGKK